MAAKPIKIQISDEAKSLLSKAASDLHLVEKNITDEKLHDHCGQHLAQATEKCLKFLISAGGGRFEKNGRYGHMLKLLFQGVEELGHFPDIVGSADIQSLIDLEVYDSNSRYDHVFEDERLNLPKYCLKAQALLTDCMRIYKKSLSHTP